MSSLIAATKQLVRWARQGCAPVSSYLSMKYVENTCTSYVFVKSKMRNKDFCSTMWRFTEAYLQIYVYILYMYKSIKRDKT